MLTYITSNYGKYSSVKNKFNELDIDLNYYKCELNEPDINDIEYISHEKAR